MPVPFAINGLGRIGRGLVRVARERPDLRLVAANDAAEPEGIARLLRHDTVHGAFPGEVSRPTRAASPSTASGWRSIAKPSRRGSRGARPAPRSLSRRPETSARASGRRRISAGRSRGVIVSAVAPDVDATFCVGINHRSYDPARHRVVSNASCTTNCLAPDARSSSIAPSASRRRS